MPNIFSRLWSAIIYAEANIYDFLLLLTEFSVRFFKSEFAIGLFGENADFSTVIQKFAWLPFALMLFGLLEAFFGRKFLSSQKLLLGFIIGFAIGTVYIAPQISKIIAIDHMVIGIALGIVIAVFKTPLYFITLSSALLYTFYYMLINVMSFSIFFALTVGAVATILTLLFLLKWVELVGTAFIGAWIFAASSSLIISYPEDHALLIARIIIAVIAILGFIVQLKSKNKKKRLLKLKKALFKSQ